MKRSIAVILFLAVSLAAIAGCYTMGDRHPIATIKFSDGGTIRARLYPQYAPNTVANFIYLANSGFYDGSPIHRIEEYSVIQMGISATEQTLDYTIEGEFSKNGFNKNSLEHKFGTLSMARKGDLESGYDTASTQFFIVSGSNAGRNFDGNYAAFGAIFETSSFDELTKISRMDVDSNFYPRDEIYIESITVDTFGKDYGEPKKIKN
ncbi:MAG: peptidylprolyl isomerase [Oscillospiraceae bacterium]|jgi:peptidyl-prolyl cis-trans isomerase B (cyclophilin B)|nr:peptidylprolyl isomerase [Oscillospiraceae bacterium]